MSKPLRLPSNIIYHGYHICPSVPDILLMVCVAFTKLMTKKNCHTLLVTVEYFFKKTYALVNFCYFLTHFWLILCHFLTHLVNFVSFFDAFGQIWSILCHFFNFQFLSILCHFLSHLVNFVSL